MLQAYALQELIKNSGHEVWIVDYRPSYMKRSRPCLKRWMFTHGRALSTIKRYFKITRKEQKSYDKYEDFIQSYMNLTNVCHTDIDLSRACCNFDYIILGSDQIWNSKFNGNDPVWFGNIPNFKGKYILYAVSSGNKKINGKFKNLLLQNIQKYSAMSVRESDLIMEISEIIPDTIDVPVVLDPSLMVNPEIWKKWQKPVRTDKYVMTYQARQDENVFRIAKELANQISHGCKIISVDFWENSFRKGIENAIISPAEFVSLINNAQCVVTTSFHGTAFSIICHTPFYTIRLNDGADGRSEELLGKLDLLDRMLDRDTSPILTKLEIERFKQNLNELRYNSQKFLEKSLQN